MIINVSLDFGILEITFTKYGTDEVINLVGRFNLVKT